MSYICGKRGKMYKPPTENTSALNEAIVTYVTAVRKPASIPKNISYHEFLSDRMLVVQAIRAGVPFSLFTLIKKETSFNDEEWADFLNISLKSLQRYKTAKDYLFKPIHSEKIFEIAEVTELGRSIFDSNEKFMLWLSTPSFALGNLKPVDLIRDSYGKEMVVRELHHIDQGIFV